jgi:ADP-ribose pyrophosphatase YjhB (NUDIX family)
VWFEGQRLIPGKIHGTGCTLASSIAARLAQGMDLTRSVEESLAYLRQAILSSFRAGRGVLLGHFPAWGPRPVNCDGEAFYASPRFCSACGRPLRGERLPSGHMHCPACGLVAWRNPLPAVTVAALQGGSILLVRRAMRPGKGLFCLPGGFLELGETIERCAARELAEETGLVAGRIELLGVETDVTEYGGIMLAVMEAFELRGDPVPGDDAAEVAWIPLDEVPPLAFTAHDRIVGSLRKARRR